MSRDEYAPRAMPPLEARLPDYPKRNKLRFEPWSLPTAYPYGNDRRKTDR